MNNNEFQYTYSAAQQNEIKKIRKKYLPKEETTDKMELLRKLDKSAETPGVIVALILGIMGTLLLGVGMCCVLMWTDFFALGIIVGILGIITLTLAYPAYKKITQRKREIIAPEILRLTDELEK